MKVLFRSLTWLLVLGSLIVGLLQLPPIQERVVNLIINEPDIHVTLQGVESPFPFVLGADKTTIYWKNKLILELNDIKASWTLKAVSAQATIAGGHMTAAIEHWGNARSKKGVFHLYLDDARVIHPELSGKLRAHMDIQGKDPFVITVQPTVFTTSTGHISISHPVKILDVPEGWFISSATLKVNKGEVKIRSLTFPEKFGGEVILDAVELAAFFPETPVRGIFKGKGSIRGTLDEPSLEFSLTGDAVSWVMPGMEFPPSRFRAEGVLSAHNSHWDMTLDSGSHYKLKSKGHLGGLYPAASLEGSIVGKGQLDILGLVMPAIAGIRGGLTVDLKVAGTIANPLLDGHGAITNGSFRNSEYGTTLRNITARFKGAGNQLTLESFSASDISKGRLSGQGHIRFKSILEPSVDIRLQVTDFLALQNDEMVARANGGIQIQGEGKLATIKGDLTLSPAEYYFDQSDREIPTIQIVSQSVVQAAPARKKKKIKGSKSLFPLDIGIKIPPGLLVKGQGVASTWKGNLRLGGDVEDVLVTGRLELVHGRFDLLGKLMELTEGSIVFTPEVINDPLLSIIAAREMGENKVFLKVNGRASSPEVSFSAEPYLPQEEVLGRLLFGKSGQNLDVGQAVEIASALTTLKGRGRGFNFKEKIQSLIGLDSLELKTKDSKDGNDKAKKSYALSIGKQISDKLRISVEQDVSEGGGSPAATVQFDISPQVKLEADVGAAQNTSVGVSWVKRY